VDLISYWISCPVTVPYILQITTVRAGQSRLSCLLVTLEKKQTDPFRLQQPLRFCPKYPARSMERPLIPSNPTRAMILSRAEKSGCCQVKTPVPNNKNSSPKDPQKNESRIRSVQKGNPDRALNRLKRKIGRDANAMLK